MAKVKDDVRQEDAGAAPVLGEYELLGVADLVAAPDNPRADLGDVTELVDSIRAVGILEPLIVSDTGDQFIVVAGHRRLAAAREAGLVDVPCIVHDNLADRARAEMMLIENLQRTDLTPLDEARAFHALIELTGMSQHELGKRIGRSQALISKRLDLLELPDEVQAQVTTGRPGDDGGITLEEAQRLLKLREHPAELVKAAKSVAKGEDAEREVTAALLEVKNAETKAGWLAEAAKHGWKVVKYEGYGYLPKGVERIATSGYGGGVEVDVKKHRKEPCHAVAVDDRHGRYGKITRTELCTDAKRHGAKGDSELKVPKKERRQRSEHEERELAQQRGRKAARARRAEFLQDRLTRKVATDRIVPLLCLAVYRGLSSDQTNAACELLGLEKTGYRAPEIGELLAKGGAEMIRAGVACALSQGHMGASAPYHGWSATDVQALYEFLRADGYDLDEFETEQLGAADEEKRQEIAEAEAGRAQALAFINERITDPLEAATFKQAVLSVPDVEWTDFAPTESPFNIKERADFVSWFEGELEQLGWKPDDQRTLPADPQPVGALAWYDDPNDGPRWVDGDEAEMIMALDPGRLYLAPDIDTGPVELDEAVAVRRCRICKCTDLEACDGGCTWVDNDLCSACVETVDILEDPDTMEAIAEAEAELAPAVTVEPKGKKFKAVCTACGEIGANTTENYAIGRGNDHLRDVHGVGDIQALAVQ